MEWNEQQIGRHLKLRDLNVLVTVVRSGSMGKAAVQLAVSQPSISRAIADMEQTLGVRLLDRSARGIEPTVYGRTMIERALSAFDELRQGVKHVEFLANPTTGELRIGSSVAFAAGFLTALVDKMSRRHPGIVFHVLAAESGMTYRALKERKVDLVVARIFGPLDEEHMDAEVLYDEEEVVAVGMKSSWSGRRRVQLEELMDDPWTLPPPDSLTGSLIVGAFRSRGLGLPRTPVFTNSVPVRTALLATGHFLTMVPGFALRFGHMAALKRLPIDLPATRRPVGIVTLKKRTLSPVAQLFIDCAREFAKSLADTSRLTRSQLPKSNRKR